MRWSSMMLNDCIIRCVFVIFGCTYYALSVHLIIFCPILCGVTLTFKLSLVWHQKSFKRKNTILLTCILYSISWLCIIIAWPTCNQCQVCAQVSKSKQSKFQQKIHSKWNMWNKNTCGPRTATVACRRGLWMMQVNIWPWSPHLLG